MKRFIAGIIAILFLAACQSKPKIDIKMPTSPPNPAAMQPGYDPQDVKP